MFNIVERLKFERAAFDAAIISAVVALGVLSYFYYYAIRLLYHVFCIAKWPGAVILIALALIAKDTSPSGSTAFRDMMLVFALVWWVLGYLLALLFHRHSYNLVLNAIRELDDELVSDLEHETNPLIIKAIQELKKKGEL